VRSPPSVFDSFRDLYLYPDRYDLRRCTGHRDLLHELCVRDELWFLFIHRPDCSLVFGEPRCLHCCDRISRSRWDRGGLWPYHRESRSYRFLHDQSSLSVRSDLQSCVRQLHLATDTHHRRHDPGSRDLLHDRRNYADGQLDCLYRPGYGIDFPDHPSHCDSQRLRDQRRRHSPIHDESGFRGLFFDRVVFLADHQCGTERLLLPFVDAGERL